MHPETAKLFVTWHQQNLLGEADEARTAVSVRRSAPTTGPRPGDVPAWRRLIGWTVVDLGARLAGGYVDSASGTH